MSVRTAIQHFTEARRSTSAFLGVVAVGGLALAPHPGQAIEFKVKGYIQAQALPLAAQSESQFATGDSGFIRLDFQINNYNAASVDTSTTSQWGPAPSLPIFDYLIISQCVEQMDCPIQPISSVTTGAWKSDPAFTDMQRFQVNGWNPTTMDYMSFPSTSTALKMSFGSSMGETGLYSKLNGIDKPITDIQIGSWYANMSPLLTQINGWKQIGANGGNSPSDMTASNIITNLNLSVKGPSKWFTPGSDGKSCSGTGGDMCQLALYFGGENKQVFFNVNQFRFAAVPGPLPLAGAAAAFACSRKLRSRVRKTAVA